MKFKRIAALTMTGALSGSLCTGAFAEGNQYQTKLKLLIADSYDSSYVMTIPADLTITSDGFNSLSGLKIAHESGLETTFDPNKKVTVSASSGNEWQLKATGVADGIAYKLKTLASDTEATTSWEFTADKVTNDGTTEALGVDVANYDDVAPGEYTDTITFEAAVESSVTATMLDNNTTAWTAGTYAVPAGGLTYSDAITVSGDVTLVLTDGETLTLNKGISIADGATLTVQGNGTMNVNGTNNSTASTVAGSTGTLILTSGTLTATGGKGEDKTERRQTGASGGAAINGSVTVNGGSLTANGGNGGNCIGDEIGPLANGGAGGAAISGDVTITDGTVTATGGNGGSIGANLFGFEVNGGAGGAAIGGNATLTGGTLTATQGANGTETGEVDYSSVGTGGKAVAGTVTNNGGTVN